MIGEIYISSDTCSLIRDYVLPQFDKDVDNFSVIIAVSAETWFTKWQWLHYDKEKDTVLCFICVKALEMKFIVRNKRVDLVIVREGLHNWKKETQYLKST